MKATIKLIRFLALAGSVLALQSCSVRLGADGSKEATLDGQGAATAIMAAGKIIIEK